jgi:Tol biopolymer transport system component
MIRRIGFMFALALSTSLAAHPMAVAVDAPRDRIMFASNRGGTFDLYSMNDDGTDTRLVVGGPRDELHPDISPDGTRIVFVRADDVARPLGPGCCGPTFDLFLANADGSGVTPLVPDPVIDDYRPDWSPDGTKIAFSRGVGFAVSNIFTIKPDGSELDQVTDGILGNNVASWSPDGTRLVFVSTRNGGTQIWVTDADGENPHPITDSPPGVANTSPQWSPTGDRIVFGSTRDGGASELYTVAPDGSELTRLTTNTLSDSYATWSPDGKQIAFSRGVSSTTSGAIWAMNADGSDQRQVSDGSFDTFPVYFPGAVTDHTHGTGTR